MPVDGRRIGTVDLLVSATFLLVGLVNAATVAGLLGGSALRRLYGTTPADPATAVLLRHRAVLLGLLGAALVVAAFVPAWRIPAGTAGLVSMVVFVVLAPPRRGLPAGITRTAVIDVLLSVLLAGALLAG